MTAPAPRLLLLTPNAANNSLGRTYCLWLLARHLGWPTRVVAVRGASLWQPLATGDFAADCRILTGLDGAARDAELDRLAAGTDLLLAVKPLPSSFGVAADVAARTGLPLMLDVDDLDVEVRIRWQPWRRRVRDRLTGRRRELLRLRERARQVPVTVCNPVLQESYGGLVIPHVRPQAPPPPPPSGDGGDSGDMVVRFVGSPRAHKGMDVLRAAVDTFGGNGVRLEVTADAPPDARAWEGWLGQTTLEEGNRLVASADVVALPSLARSWSLAQLPAKLMDAMMLGRAVVASDLPPIRWALGDAGILVRPGDRDALAAALHRLRDPGERHELGVAAHRRASAMLSVEAVAPAFEGYVRAALAGRPGQVVGG